MSETSQLLQCVFAASITCVATGLGALPFLYVKNTEGYFLRLCSACAAGMMIGASIVLLWEGVGCDSSFGYWILIVGIWLGWATMSFLRDYFPESVSILDLHGADAKQALLVLGSMFLHSFAEGMGIGVSYAGSDRLGHAVSMSLAVHNVPEGFAVCVVLIEKGVSLWKAALISILTSIPQPVACIPAYMFVQSFRHVLSGGLGFAAGAMALVTVTELLPEAREGLENDILLYIILFINASIMLLFHFAELV